VNGTIGFEILAPLRLADGSTVLVDRGWVPVGPGGATRIPTVPAATTGEVTVTGRVHQPESRSDPPVTVDGALTVRRIAPARLGGTLGVDRVYPDYVLLDRQQPAAAPGFTTITADREPSWMNAGYTVQWWAFSLLALVGFGWAARREAHDRRDGIVRTPRGTPGTPSRSRDRVADAELSSHTMR
jgi:cytochrome oxidase assembly protein ShyY1